MGVNAWVMTQVGYVMNQCPYEGCCAAGEFYSLRPVVSEICQVRIDVLIATVFNFIDELHYNCQTFDIAAVALVHFSLK